MAGDHITDVRCQQSVGTDRAQKYLFTSYTNTVITLTFTALFLPVPS